MPAETVIIQAPCNGCGRKTDHEVLKTYVKTVSDDEEGNEWRKTCYRMIECRGCHFISLERSVTSYEDQQGDAPQKEYYPPPISRREPSWIGEFVMNVPIELDLPDLLTEIYSALHANNRRLATMGARTLLDIVMTDKVTDVGRFDQKLDALEKEFVTKKQREFLEAALDVGNAASHRGHCPTAKQLDQVMDIVENILQQIYVLPNAATELKKSTPPRKKKPIIIPTRRQSPPAQ
ncbi:MAG: DUF4145 domain-containing protein [Limisphaerales bacterium]